VPNFSAKQAAANAGGVTLATFNQADSIDAFISTVRRKEGSAEAREIRQQAGKGVCYVLSLRFIVQSILGMPPLGIDLERKYDTPLSLFRNIPENTAIFRRFPQINDDRLPMNVAIAAHQQYRDMLGPWLAGQRCAFGPDHSLNMGFGPGIGAGRLVASYLNDKRDMLLKAHGYGLFGATGQTSGHAMVVHTGASGEWMFIDVNFGWFIFPSFAVFQEFMGEFWFGAGYTYAANRFLQTVKRSR
jgi:hypothetical protein